MGIEILESRIAPAAVLHYMDTDGDKVTVKTSQGTSADLASICNLKASGALGGMHLNKIDFAENSTIAAEFAGTDLTITVIKSVAGDGKMDVGVINAYGGTVGTDIALGKVSIQGSLGSINAGTGSSTGNAIASLTVKSINGDASAYPSHIYGNAGTISVSGAFLGKLTVDDTINKLTVGRLVGGTTDYSGYIIASDINTLTIKGNMVGGSGISSGSITVLNTLQTATINGSILGGDGQSDATLRADTLGTLLVKQSIKGGSSSFSGAVYVHNGAFQSITVNGGILGGDGDHSGRIIQTGASSADGKVVVKGSVKAGGGHYSGEINMQGTLSSLHIFGTLKGAGSAYSGSYQSGAVLAKAFTTIHIDGGRTDNGLIWVNGIPH